MTTELIGLLGIFGLLTLLTLGVPIGVALALVGLAGLSLLISPEAALIKSGVVSFEVISKYELGVLPLFLLMAHICFAAGASRDFFDVAAKFVGHRRGGLALASIGGCAGFGAISGSSLATVATISSVALPGNAQGRLPSGLRFGCARRRRHPGLIDPAVGRVDRVRDHRRAVDRQGCSRPPSYRACRRRCSTWRQSRFYAGSSLPSGRAPSAFPGGIDCPPLRKIIDLLILIVFVIGGLMVGWFTPTEAASVGVVGALLLWALRGGFTWSGLSEALRSTLRTTGMIYVVIIGAILFATFISVTGITDLLSSTVTDFHASPMHRDHRHGARAAPSRLFPRRPGADAADYADLPADRRRSRL